MVKFIVLANLKHDCGESKGNDWIVLYFEIKWRRSNPKSKESSTLTAIILLQLLPLCGIVQRLIYERGFNIWKRLKCGTCSNFLSNRFELVVLISCLAAAILCAEYSTLRRLSRRHLFSYYRLSVSLVARPANAA